jgi:hypothetical protein
MTDVSFETLDITGGPNEMGLMQSLFSRTFVNQEKVHIGTEEGRYDVALTCLKHCGNDPQMWHFEGRALPRGKVQMTMIGDKRNLGIPYPPVKVEGEYNVKTRKGVMTVTLK